LASAAAPPTPTPPPPTTLWSFLGIPQGFQKIRDATTNTLGNHPKWERKPALKRIADPANLASDNPAIQAAAKIKADTDLAPQKIKAIKYLATVCCNCAKNKEEVRDALLAALDDCTEEVRYEAAVALCKCAGDVCTICNRGSCCDAKIMNKLTKMAEGKDAQDCWLEPSARVRAAAAYALSACQQVHRPTAAPPPPEGVESPRIAPPKEPGAEQPSVSPSPSDEPPKKAPAVPEKLTALPAEPKTSADLDDESASTMRIRIIAPAAYDEPAKAPTTKVEVLRPEARKAAARPATAWPVAAAVLDPRWQRPIIAGPRY
jgi:hypothetical protein